MRFGNGNDSLLFGATSKISGNVDGGGGTNDLTLNAGAGESATLGGAVANFSTITKTGAGGWAILGGVPSTPGDPNPSSPITGSLNNITSLTVDEGYLSLIGANPDFTGTTTINAAGTLSVQAQGINNSTQVTNNGTLIFDQSFDDTYSGAAITGTGQLNKQGSGDLIMSSQGANTYSGGTHVYEGAIVVDQDSDLGASTGSLTLGSSISSGNTNGTLKFDSSFDLSTTRDITLADGGGTIDTQSYNTTITQDISGTGSLTKDGSGVLELHGSKTYTGNTFVQAGTLAIDAENSLGTGTQLILQDTSTLRLDANNIDITRGVTLGGAPGSQMAIDTQGYTGTVSGTIGGQGALVKNGTGFLQLYANNSYGGGTIINEGTVAINADSGLGNSGGTLTMNDQTTLQLDSSVTSTGRTITLGSGSATINTQANNGIFGGNIGGSGQLVKTGSGVLGIYGSSTYQGGTQIQEGTLAINSDSSLGAASGALELWNQTTLHLDGNAAMTARAVEIGNTGVTAATSNLVTIDTNGYAAQINGNITEASNVDATGGVRIDKTGDGVLALYGQNEHRGGTWVQQGTVAVNSNESLGTGPNSYVYLGNGSGSVQGTLRFDAAFDDSDFFTKQVVLNQSGGIIDTQGNTVIFADNTLVNGSDTTHYGSAPYWMGDGDGSMTKVGSGVMGIDGFQFYRGDTLINQGTMRIYSFDVNTPLAPIGVVNTSHVEIAAGARLEGQGVIGNMLNQEIYNDPNNLAIQDMLDIVGTTPGVTATTFVNSGTIAPGLDRYLWNTTHPTIPVTQFNSLTLAGNYSAKDGAAVEISTELIDDTSMHGTLVITGSVDQAGAVTAVKVNHQGGTGATTDQGIEIIRILGSADHAAQGKMFRLVSDFTAPNGKPAVVAGAYSYWLEDDVDWDYTTGTPIAGQSGLFLRNLKKSNGNKVINPNTPLYESYALILGNLNRLPTLEQRVGHRNWRNDAYPDNGGERIIENRALWAQVEGDTGTYKPSLGSDDEGESSKYDLDFSRFNMGVDWPLHVADNGSKLIGGLNISFGHGSAKVRSDNGDGNVKTDSEGIGATLTWYADNGFYADTQARYNWFSTDINSSTIKSAGHQVSSNNGDGHAFSLEIGRIFNMKNPQWSLTPQAQLVYSRTSFDSFVDAQSNLVVQERSYKSLEGRLGLALNYERSYLDNNGELRRNKLYGLVNYYHEFKGDSTISLSSVKYKSQVSDNWIGLAVGGSYNWNQDKYSFYGEVEYRGGIDHFSSERELVGKIGVRLAF